MIVVVTQEKVGPCLPLVCSAAESVFNKCLFPRSLSSHWQFSIFAYVAFILWLTQALALSQVSPSQPSEVVVSAKGSLPSASVMSDATTTTASVSTEDIPLYVQRILNTSHLTGQVLL